MISTSTASTAIRCLPYAIKQVLRHRVRTGLTVVGIAISMFLFTAVQAMDRGVTRVTQHAAAETSLIVYRADRFCPATSELPEDYKSRIERVAGVESVMPMRVVVNNCRAGLDVVTFRGVPREQFLASRGERLKLLSGSKEDWLRRTDAALVGETLAARRGLSTGMSFNAAGITVNVAGIITSDDEQDRNAVYTALEFLQLAGRDTMGIVTQFSVTVKDPSLLEPVADEIDAMFARSQAPTTTFTEQAFLGRVAADVIELVAFARWLALGCLVAVLALVANSIVLSAQSRIAEHAVLQTLGFTGPLVAWLIIAEGVLLSLAGGALGAVAALAAVQHTALAISVEGVTIPIVAELDSLLVGVAICAALGVIAGLVPAWQASRRQITECFRAV